MDNNKRYTTPRMIVCQSQSSHPETKSHHLGLIYHHHPITVSTCVDVLRPGNNKYSFVIQP
jgi:hypothetical protein